MRLINILPPSNHDFRGQRVHQSGLPLQGRPPPTQIRLQPKRNIFKHLSLDTDLEEINQVLSPKAQPAPPLPSASLDRELTRRFVLQLITTYESENEANAKWEGFLKSMDDAQSFEVFVQSLKEIKEERKAEPAVNPENEIAKDGTADRNRKIGRSASCKKVGSKEGEKADRKEGKAVNGLREKIREEVNGLKDLLLAGEKFLREMVNDYS
jgi:hypothetical protein